MTTVPEREPIPDLRIIENFTDSGLDKSPEALLEQLTTAAYDSAEGFARRGGESETDGYFDGGNVSFGYGVGGANEFAVNANSDENGGVVVVYMRPKGTLQKMALNDQGPIMSGFPRSLDGHWFATMPSHAISPESVNRYPYDPGIFRVDLVRPGTPVLFGAWGSRIENPKSRMYKIEDGRLITSDPHPELLAYLAQTLDHTLSIGNDEIEAMKASAKNTA